MISIIIPTYFPRVSELDRMLRSIARQTFKDFEVIVVDDCTPQPYGEKKKKVCEKYKKHMDISYYRHTPNRGAPYSRNFGARKAKYSYLCFVDDDDELLPERLEVQYGFMSKPENKQYDVTYVWGKEYYEGGKIIELKSKNVGDFRKEILERNFIPMLCGMVTKKAFDAVGGFDEDLTSCQDWDLWVRLAQQNECHYIPKFLIKVYKHGNISIGLWSKGVDGFRSFISKHTQKYLDLDMMKELEYYLRYIFARYIKERRFSDLRSFLGEYKGVTNSFYINFFSRFFLLTYLLVFPFMIKSYLRRL